MRWQDTAVVLAVCAVLMISGVFGFRRYKVSQKNKETAAWFEAQHKAVAKHCPDFVFWLRIQAEDAASYLRENKAAINDAPYRPEDEFHGVVKRQFLNFRQMCSLHRNAITTAIEVVKSCFEPPFYGVRPHQRCNTTLMSLRLHSNR